MSNKSSKPKKKISEMRAEYDFSRGARGRHAAAYAEGHSVTIHKKDGTTVVQNFRLEEGAVIIEPDVRKYFPDAESVNRALRSLISARAGTRRRVRKDPLQPSPMPDTPK
ncbi:MAG: hypothetical protein ACOYZ8_01150 [Chloroflexota bacterium]